MDMDPAMKIKEMNTAREKIKGEPYLFGKNKINESIEYNLCENLVLLSELEYEKVLLAAKEEAELQNRLQEKRKRRKIIEEDVKEIKSYFINEVNSNETEMFCGLIHQVFGDIETFVVGDDLFQDWEDKDYEEIIATYNENNIGQKCDLNLEDSISLYRETLSE